MKIDKWHIILAVVAIFLLWGQCSPEDPEPDPVTIEIDGSEGTSGIVDVKPEVETDTVTIVEYIEGDTEYVTNYVVDKEYKELYEKTNDSLKRLSLYLEAIRITERNDTLVDNEDITITHFSKYRGELLQYKTDYTIKPKEFTYTPEVVTKLPSLSVAVGLEGGVPTVPNGTFAVKANLEVMNKKGNSVTFSYDTDGRAWVGLKRTFKLKK